MNNERKYSNNSIFANNEVTATNPNNITPNNETSKINESLSESSPFNEEQQDVVNSAKDEQSTSNNNINKTIAESETSFLKQDLNIDTNQAMTNDLIFDTNSNINNNINNKQSDTTNNLEDSKSLSSQELNSKSIEDLPSSSQQNHDNNYNFEPEKKRRKNNILPIIIIAIALIFVGGLIACKALPMFQNKFKIMINETFKYLDSNIKNAEDTTSNMTLKIKSTTNNETLKNLEKLNFSANYAIDYKNKLLSLDIKSSYDNNPLLNASIYGQSKSIYAILDKLYDKTIEMPLDEEYDKIFTQTTNQKEQKIVLKSINKALNNALKENYFTKGKDTVNGTKVDTTTLTINKDNYQVIKKDLINALLKDKKFIESTAKISDMTAKEIEEKLKEARDEKKEITDELKLTIYTKGTNFVKFEIKGEDVNISINAKKDQYEYTINNGEESVTGIMKITSNKDETSTNLTLKYSDVSIEITSSAKKGANITKKDTSNSINYKEIPKSDLTKILLNLFQSKGLTKFMEDFNLNSSPLEDDYDYTWSLNDDDWSYADSNL